MNANNNNNSDNIVITVDDFTINSDNDDLPSLSSSRSLFLQQGTASGATTSITTTRTPLPTTAMIGATSSSSSSSSVTTMTTTASTPSTMESPKMATTTATTAAIPNSTPSTGSNPNIPYTSNTSISSSMVLESKIQNVAASLRQKRDESYRSYQLATERLRLVQQEADALNATVHDLQRKLHHLQQQAPSSSIGNKIESATKDDNGSTTPKTPTDNKNDNTPTTPRNCVKEELQKLYSDIDLLTKQMTFQHQELVMKRTKNDDIKTKMERNTTKYDTVRANLERAIRGRRIYLMKEKQQQQQREQQAENERSYGTMTNRNAALMYTGTDNYKDDTKENQENIDMGDCATPNVQTSTEKTLKRRTELDPDNTLDRREELQEIINADHNGRLFSKWPSIIRAKIDRNYTILDQIKTRNKELHNIVIKYGDDIQKTSNHSVPMDERSVLGTDHENAPPSLTTDAPSDPALLSLHDESNIMES